MSQKVLDLGFWVWDLNLCWEISVKSLHFEDMSADVRLNIVPLDLGAEIALLQRPVASAESQAVFC